MGLRRAILVAAFLAPGAALRAADCNRNGSEDGADIVEGRSADCNRNGVPDECDTLPAAFELAPTIPLDRVPIALAAADLDGDGDLDAAAAAAGGVTVLEGDGRGGIGATRTEPLADDPVAILAADTDGDGDTDLVVADALQDVHGRGTLSLLENDGGGRFRPARARTVPAGPAAIAAADLDGDGDHDIALACKDARGVAIFRADGRGSYAEEPLLATEGSPTVLAATDVDRDGKTDLLSGDRSGTLFLFLQRTAGAMDRASVRAGAAFKGFAVGDLGADGDADVALSRTASDGSGLLLVLENDGQGRFAAGPERSLPAGSPSLAAADLDGDGRNDLLTVDAPAASITVWPGGEGAADAPGRAYATGPDPFLAAAADLESDGDVDVLVAGAGGLSVLLNAGSGRIEAPRSMHVGLGAGKTTSVEVLPDGRTAPLDLDRDGRPDLVVALYAYPGQCTVVLGGTGGFPEETVRLVAGPRSSVRRLVAADLDGDGLPDLALAHWDSTDGGLSLHRNGGRRNFARAGVLAPGTGVSFVDAGDFDQDGDMDLASVADRLSVWENRGDGTFPRRRQLDVGRGTLEVAAADLDGDLDVDIAATAGGDSKIAIFENLGGGNYAGAQAIEADGSSRLVAADLDGDGSVDLAAEGRAGLLVFWNRGDATFERQVHPVAGYEVQSISPADADGDGDVDLAVAGFEDGPLELFVNRGRRWLEPLPPLAVSGRVLSVGAADLDADGRVEVLASMSDAGTILVLRTSPAASRDRNGNGIPDECEGTLFVRGDADADGRIGIADALVVLLHLFRGGPGPPCDASADADGDGRLLLGDPVSILGYLFRRGPEPAAPFPDCGAFPPGEALPCKEYPPCSG
jgi:hypothetical protein